MAEHEDENVKVVLRVRPLNEVERSRGDKRVLKCMDDGRSVRLSSSGMEDFGRGSASQKDFVFSACLDEGTDQQTFFEHCGVKSLISKTLEGYSTTLFAYGQTGSGKTYSISGAEDVIGEPDYSGGDPREGLVPRAARLLYEQMRRSPHRGYTLKAACFEIYNEQVLDLLNPDAGQLQIRESRTRGFFVENLLVVECGDVSDLMEVFKEGTRNRKVGPHAMNRDSSRSHSALVMYVDSTTKDEETGEDVRQYGKLTFVDLAGSERLKYTGSSGEMLKETGNINRSLFTLGKVIALLDKGEAFVPYRDSKLTKVLMDSLGGTSLCIMVACCSPASKYIEETLSTLQYASRARNIRNKPVVQVDAQQRLIMSLRAEIAALKTENASLRAGLGLPAPPTSSSRRGIASGSGFDQLRDVRSRQGPLSPDRSPRALNRQDSAKDVRPRSMSTSAAEMLSGHESAPLRESRSFSGLLSSPSTPLTLPPYEKAVGYAEGYAAGLDQVREVLSSRGLDLGSSLTTYDLTGGGLGTPTRASRKGSSLLGRLPPLPDPGLQWGWHGQEGLGGNGQAVRGSWQAEDAGQLRMHPDHSAHIIAEFQQENARLRQHNAQLQEERAQMEHKRASWEDQCRKVQRQLDEHMMTRCQRPGGGAEADFLVAQSKIARVEAENADLRLRLQALQGTTAAGHGEFPQSQMHPSEFPRHDQGVMHHGVSGSGAAHSQRAQQHPFFLSTEGPIWSGDHWDISSEKTALASSLPSTVPSAYSSGRDEGHSASHSTGNSANHHLQGEGYGANFPHGVGHGVNYPQASQAGWESNRNQQLAGSGAGRPAGEGERERKGPGISALLGAGKGQGNKVERAALASVARSDPESDSGSFAARAPVNPRPQVGSPRISLVARDAKGKGVHANQNQIRS